MRTLTESEHYTIANALRVAASAYLADSKHMHHLRLKQQFFDQASEASKLAKEFEEQSA